jgi:hypothetical protein
MKMGIAMSFGVGSLILMLQPMPADFKIDGTLRTRAMAREKAASAPTEATAPGSPKSHLPARTGAAIAVGFGRHVPLEFAVRQVAPRWVRVSYGESVDRQVRISWRGGRPWNLVLGSVLTPLGLHMTMSGRTLWIRG